MSQRVRRGLAIWLTSSRTPVFVLDQRRVVLVFNRGCEELTGWKGADVIGKVCQFQSDPDPSRITALTGALCPGGMAAGDRPWRRRTLIVRPDGTSLEQEIHFFPLLSETADGEVHILGVMTAPQTEIAAPLSPSLDISRHTADLYRRYRVDRIVAASPAMQRVVAQIEVARQCQASVHLTGEPGSGREHIARLIHYGSALRGRRFVPLRCHTASHFELHRTLTRLFEAASHDDIGTVYLEQVESLPGDLQQLIQEQQGQFPGRWMSSSRSGLDALRDEHFTPSLRTQLTALNITLPPLRSRSEDLPLLAQQLLEEANAGKEQQCTELSPAVLRLFSQHAWPGNVDELARTVNQARDRAADAVIDVDDLPFDFRAALESRSVRPPPLAISLDEELLQFERRRIEQALAEARGNKTLAAERLGIPRPRLYRRLEQLGLLGDTDAEDSP